jgi:hypothetical protein
MKFPEIIKEKNLSKLFIQLQVKNVRIVINDFDFHLKKENSLFKTFVLIFLLLTFRILKPFFFSL